MFSFCSVYLNNSSVIFAVQLDYGGFLVAEILPSVLTMQLLLSAVRPVVNESKQSLFCTLMCYTVQPEPVRVCQRRLLFANVTVCSFVYCLLVGFHIPDTSHYLQVNKSCGVLSPFLLWHGAKELTREANLASHTL